MQNSTNNLNTERPKIFPYVWLAALIIIAGYIRVHGAGVYHYSADEAMHVNIAKGSSLKEVLTFSLYETHPPLGHILRHYWMMVSEAPWFVRSLSLIFGIALIPLYYLIGKKLNGELTGITTATLIAFSCGCIIQSYVARNYTIFLFFLSASFYAYVIWRDRHPSNALIGYTVFAVLACLTHFSGIFAIFCIAAYQAIIFCARKVSWREQLKWAFFNLAIAIVAVGVYCVWYHNALTPVMKEMNFISSTAAHKSISLSELNIFYVLGSLIYILPGCLTPDYILFLLIAFIAAATLLVSHRKEFFHFVALGWIAFIVGIILCDNTFYPPLERRSLWLLPFILVPTGWLIAEIISWIINRNIKPLPCAPLGFLAALLLVVGWVSYNPEKRFANKYEYPITQENWQQLQQYLATLDKTDLVVLGRDTLFFIDPASFNPYHYITNNPDNAVSLIPYQHTSLLLDGFDQTLYKGAILMQTLKNAEEHHVLEGISHLIFINTLWTSPPVTDLILCPTLAKKIITFPASAGPNANPKETPIMILIIEKKDFFAPSLSPQTKAADCLKD